MPGERQGARRVRASIVEFVRASPPQQPLLGPELLFHLQAQAYQRELNERYFPASELTERERIHRMARLVGLEAPKHAPLDPPPDRSASPPTDSC